MNTLTKLVLGAMGALRPTPPRGDSAATIVLPPPETDGGVPLLQAIAKRRSSREFRKEPLPLQQLSTLLWAADGVNRSDGGRTAPSALDAREIDIIVALPEGTYRFEPASHALVLERSGDLRPLTGYQDFVDTAPLDLIYVADHSRMALVPAAMRHGYACVAAGAIAQNVYLYAASAGMATVLRAWIDRESMASALGLSHDREVLLAQTVGFAAQ